MILLLFTALAFAATTVAADPVRIKAKSKGKFCISKADRGWGNGTNIVLMRCNDATAEMVVWEYDRRSGYLRSASNSGKCLHKRAPGWKNGNNVHLWDCSAGDSNAKTWIYEKSTGYIRAAGNRSKCLHKKFPDWTSGNNIHLWDCDAGPKKNKTWKLKGYGGSVRDMFRAAGDESDVQRYYVRNEHGLCLTVNVFDQTKSRKQKAKRVLKTVFDPREHAKNVAGISGAMFLGPGGPELITTVRAIKRKRKLEAAWKGDTKQGMGVTLLECGAVDPEYQKFIRDGRYLRTRDGKHCLKAKDGQATDNGGRVQIGSCKRQQRAAWYVDEREFRNGKGKCLDVHRPDRTREGAKVQLWNCTGRSQQKWNLSY
ncbi:RICIN domain-containing protein [Lentisalinibacter orientalis]|uniref:RICIN domain-containing protein n=1 Tax=Lentisalinibacter orientalis TaxID=2992241 RepID=UPI0038674A5F